MAHLPAPEPSFARGKRRPRIRDLQRSHDAPAVVRVDPCRCVGIALRESLVGGLRTDGVILALPALAGTGRRRRRQVELDERSAQVQAGSADHDGRYSLRQRVVDRAMCELRVLADGRLVVQRPNTYELCRPV